MASRLKALGAILDKIKANGPYYRATAMLVDDIQRQTERDPTATAAACFYYLHHILGCDKSALVCRVARKYCTLLFEDAEPDRVYTLLGTVYAFDGTILDGETSQLLSKVKLLVFFHAFRKNIWFSDDYAKRNIKFEVELPFHQRRTENLRDIFSQPFLA